MAYNHYRYTPGWGTQQVCGLVLRPYLSFAQYSYLQFQLGAPPLPTYQPLPTCMCATSLENWGAQNSYLSHTGSGLDFYSAHAMGGDPYVVGWIVK